MKYYFRDIRFYLEDLHSLFFVFSWLKMEVTVIIETGMDIQTQIMVHQIHQNFMTMLVPKIILYLQQRSRILELFCQRKQILTPPILPWRIGHQIPQRKKLQNIILMTFITMITTTRRTSTNAKIIHCFKTWQQPNLGNFSTQIKIM